MAGWFWAATTGDGRWVRTRPPMSPIFPDIPQVLKGAVPDLFEVRGEVYMERAAWWH